MAAYPAVAMVGQMHVPQRAPVVVADVVPGDLRAHRELQEQGVQQVHRGGLVAVVRRIEDRPQACADRAETGDVRVGGAAGRLLVASEEVADGLDRGQRVLAPGRVLAVDEPDGVVRVIGQFHL